MPDLSRPGIEDGRADAYVALACVGAAEAGVWEGAATGAALSPGEQDAASRAAANVATAARRPLMVVG
ncbi:MAG: hypothetical protein M3290_04355 [Actinomycetota bacterium]|nr:hypothetical protein [Actinomycetota bacterium]